MPPQTPAQLPGGRHAATALLPQMPGVCRSASARRPSCLSSADGDQHQPLTHGELQSLMPDELQPLTPDDLQSLMPAGLHTMMPDELHPQPETRQILLRDRRAANARRPTCCKRPQEVMRPCPTRCCEAPFCKARKL